MVDDDGDLPVNVIALLGKVYSGIILPLYNPVSGTTGIQKQSEETETVKGWGRPIYRRCPTDKIFDFWGDGQ